jgi:hypothetical protein
LLSESFVFEQEGLLGVVAFRAANPNSSNGIICSTSPIFEKRTARASGLLEISEK